MKRMSSAPASASTSTLPSTEEDDEDERLDSGTELDDWHLLEESGSEGSSSPRPLSLHAGTHSDAHLTRLDVQESSSFSAYNAANDDDEDDNDDDLQLALAMSLDTQQRNDTTQGSSLQSSSSTDTAIWTTTAHPGSFFSAIWRVQLDGVEEEHLILDPWGDRFFLHSECDGKCIHRKVIRAQDANSTQSTLKYHIQALHLRAPLTCGHYTERWRLRNIFGQLVGPILEMQ
jgi:hypothetical protein